MNGIILFVAAMLLVASPVQAEEKGTCLAGDCQDGTGTFQWNDGTKFTGSFIKGVPDGDGLYVDGTGREFTVTFIDGKPLPPRKHPVRRK